MRQEQLNSTKVDKKARIKPFKRDLVISDRFPKGRLLPPSGQPGARCPTSPFFFKVFVPSPSIVLQGFYAEGPPPPGMNFGGCAVDIGSENAGFSHPCPWRLYCRLYFNELGDPSKARPSMAVCGAGFPRAKVACFSAGFAPPCDAPSSSGDVKWPRNGSPFATNRPPHHLFTCPAGFCGGKRGPLPNEFASPRPAPPVSH